MLATVILINWPTSAYTDAARCGVLGGGRLRFGVVEVVMVSGRDGVVALVDDWTVLDALLAASRRWEMGEAVWVWVWVWVLWCCCWCWKKRMEMEKRSKEEEEHL
jgi:hypothetical protein